MLVMTPIDIPRGLSTGEAELYKHLITHVQFEAGLAEKYDELAQSTTEYVGFLAAIIAEDERRHHHLYELWAETLRGMAEFRDAGIPWLGKEDDPAKLIEATEKFLEFERRDVDELKELSKSIKDMRDTTLWGLVLELMRADSEKHIKILTFIRNHAKDTNRKR
jgi:hypothetical protein